MRSIIHTVCATVVSNLLPLALADGNNGHIHDSIPSTDMNMAISGHGHNTTTPMSEGEYLPTYFALVEHAGVMYAHIGIMVASWVFILPVAVMLSLARSRYVLALQSAFFVTNALGVVLAIIYNSLTPDLYPNNAHNLVGWITSLVAFVYFGISTLGHVRGILKNPSNPFRGRPSEYRAIIPLSTASIAQRNHLDSSAFTDPYRFSNDSGHGTERNTESLHSRTVSWSSRESSPRPSGDTREQYTDNTPEVDLEDGPIMSMPMIGDKIAANDEPLLSRLVSHISCRVWKSLILAYNIIDRVIMLLGFVAFCLGIITYGRFFEGRAIFTGLAHWIKGSIFFWLGIFTLGRWSGSFGELGWAWNVRPKHAHGKWRPSAEFVESFLIFFYGATNIFLEHLGNAGKEWSAQDLEHVSITVLFIGGGLLGMLVESSHVRELLNTTVSEPTLGPKQHGADTCDVHEKDDALQPPRQYEFSVNPIPALVILLLGIMMSSHQQHTMISSMVHKQWGNLLTAASFARGFTYVLLYLKPPRSVYPSRPPTELLAAFGLIAGGIIFMASSSDTVLGMVHYDLDAMFMYTVTMGFVGLLMAWVIAVLALKGWAIRKEGARRQTLTR